MTTGKNAEQVANPTFSRSSTGFVTQSERMLPL
jgi:hypothetical protein